jgi:hypothetical protein
VTAGGLSEAGQWVAVRHGLLLPMRVVMAVFRGKRWAAIRAGIAQGELTLPAGKRPPALGESPQPVGPREVEGA